MSDGKDSSTTGNGGLTRRTAWIAGVLILVVLLMGAGIAAVVASNRGASLKLGPVAGGQTTQVAPPASAPDAASSSTATAATTITATGTTGTANGAAGKDRPASDAGAARPTDDVLGTLKSGQWRLYGSRVIAKGTEMKAEGSTDVQGISVECEALTRSGSGYAHATVRIAFSASGPASGSGGPWKLFGTWVLSPDSGSGGNQHYGQGIGGALRGRSTVRPPARSGNVVAGFSPIGAYRPKGAGVIESGRFSGNAMFEGVLTLPSIAMPPPK